MLVLDTNLAMPVKEIGNLILAKEPCDQLVACLRPTVLRRRDNDKSLSKFGPVPPKKASYSLAPYSDARDKIHSFSFSPSALVVR